MLTAQALLGDPTDWQRITLSPSTRITPTVAVETNTPLLSVDVDPQLPKHIRYLYAKYLSVRQMLDTGLVIQAWTTFPSLVREVELYGCECPCYPPSRSFVIDLSKWTKITLPRKGHQVTR